MPKPTPEALDAILTRVRAPIWDKPTPPPKPRATWQRLRVGDRLTSGGFTFQVETVDSSGVSIRMVIPFKSAAARRIESAEVLATFTKVRPPRAPRRNQKETT